jgi:hypothetical protein
MPSFLPCPRGFVNVIIAISLSELSLFKDLRRPPDPLALKYFRLPSPRSEALSCNGILRRRALAMRRSASAPCRPMWQRSFIASRYGDVF